MNRYFIYLAYNGANYCGWQNQPNGISVQQKVEEALRVLLRKQLSITGAGRTDAGVHARMMVAHFDWMEEIADLLSLTEKLNCVLPFDISVRKIRPVAGDAHARFDALSRTYKYYICEKKDPFTYPFHYKIKSLPDFEKMNEAAAILSDNADFSCFSKSHTDVKTKICRIMQAEWKPEATGWVFTIQADRFLRNMVRAIVGTLLEVGWGKLSLEDFRQVIESKDRRNAGASVPGKALFLIDIEYPESIFIHPPHNDGVTINLIQQ
jgi:tRNA pseudouridine38-40 synthase